MNKYMYVVSLVSLVGCAKAPMAHQANNTQDVHALHCPAKECFKVAEYVCHGKDYHAMTETGFAFPAMIQEDDHMFRYLIACEP